MAGDPVMAKRIDDLERLVGGLSLSANSDGKDNATGVVGGLQDAASEETAKDWLNEVLQKASIDGILDVYSKSKATDKFNGMLFIKFASSQKRDVAIRTFNSLRTKFTDKNTFMNPERPFQQRVMNSFLLNLKRTMVDEWGYNASCLQVDTSTQTLSVQGKEILKTHVNEFKMKIDWVQPAWGEWKEFVEDANFKELLKVAENKLTTTSKSMDKGKGKGPQA